MLLSEVAVVATISDVIPGFIPADGPAVLLALSDVEPLVTRSPFPSYVLVSVPRLVIHNRLFCRLHGPQKGYEPRIGSRVVVLGHWGASGIVPLTRYINTGAFAEIDGDGALEWRHTFFPRDTLADLRDRIDELEEAGLFALTHNLSRQSADSDERHDFADNYHLDNRCPLVSVERLPETGEWSVVRDCDSNPPPVER